MKIAREAVFYISTHQIVQVEVHLQSPVLKFPLNQCGKCSAMFAQSGVIEAVRRVDWEMIHTSTFNPFEIVSKSGKVGRHR